MAGGVPLAPWNEIVPLAARKNVLLEVRRPAERAKGLIPGSIPIPLDPICARMSELPRDRAIVVHCLSGQRSHFAAGFWPQTVSACAT